MSASEGLFFWANFHRETPQNLLGVTNLFPMFWCWVERAQGNFPFGSDLHLMLSLSCVTLSVGKPAHFLLGQGRQWPLMQEVGGDLDYCFSFTHLQSVLLSPTLYPFSEGSDLSKCWAIQGTHSSKQHASYCHPAHPSNPHPRQLRWHSWGPMSTT